MSYAELIKSTNRASLRGRFDQIAPDAETMQLLQRVLEAETTSDTIIMHERLRDLYRKFTKTLILKGAYVPLATVDALAFPALRDDLAALQGAFIIWLYKIGQAPSPQRITFETITNCHDSLLHWNHEVYVKRGQKVVADHPHREWVSEMIMAAVDSAISWPKQMAKRTLIAQLPEQSSVIDDNHRDGENDNRAAQAQDAIRQKIRACLARANHPNTPEAEARTSLFVAKRLMAQHDMSQADVLAEACESGMAASKGARSVVSIVRTRGKNIKVFTYGWVGTLGYAMRVFFNCRAFTQRTRTSVEWHFYGIAANTISAAVAFEMLHNLAQEWSATRKTKSARDYLLGFAKGMCELAWQERRVEEQMAQEQEAKHLQKRTAAEEAQRQQERDRLHRMDDSLLEEDVEHHPARLANDNDSDSESEPEDSEQGDSDGDDDRSADLKASSGSLASDEDRDEDKDDRKNGANKQASRAIKLEEEVTPPRLATLPRLQTPKRKRSPSDCPAPLVDPPAAPLVAELYAWDRTSALQLFRKSALHIADEYKKASGIKTRAGVARSRTIRDRAVYQLGKEDARKVDVHGAGRKRIGDGA